MPVIMMSGHATIETAVEATRIGALAFLEKPITLQKLLKAVEQGLSRKPVVTTSVAPKVTSPVLAAIETAVQDLKTVLVGLDPGRIELIWQKMLLAMMGHGMTGVVGAGAMTGIEVALWDILGKRLGVPVVDLLGGMCREKIRTYAHASEPEAALRYVEQGYTCLKAGGLRHPIKTVKNLRHALPDHVDLCIDVHGPPWLTVPDAVLPSAPLGWIFTTPLVMSVRPE